MPENGPSIVCTVGRPQTRCLCLLDEGESAAEQLAGSLLRSIAAQLGPECEMAKHTPHVEREATGELHFGGCNHFGVVGSRVGATTCREGLRRCLTIEGHPGQREAYVSTAQCARSGQQEAPTSAAKLPAQAKIRINIADNGDNSVQELKLVLHHADLTHGASKRTKGLQSLTPALGLGCSTCHDDDSHTVSPTQATASQLAAVRAHAICDCGDGCPHSRCRRAQHFHREYGTELLPLHVADACDSVCDRRWQKRSRRSRGGGGSAKCGYWRTDTRAERARERNACRTLACLLVVGCRLLTHATRIVSRGGFRIASGTQCSRLVGEASRRPTPVLGQGTG
mmetsp:Transcript_98981/g.317417  ORF Transcript_98981/g.317417 Transcript_98981/m.317417 type:complete len:340 (+) Transcript_98981:3477-4496(+)